MRVLSLFPRRLQYFFGLVVIFFLIQSSFRLLFWGFVSELPVAFDGESLKAIWIGLRFDLRVSLLIAMTTLPCLVVPKYNATNYPSIRLFLQFSVAFALLGVLLIYVVDAGHYYYLHKRLDASIVRFSSDIVISIKMLWQSYPIIKITTGVAVFLGLVVWFHRRYLIPLLCAQRVTVKWRRKIVYVIILCMLFLLILLGRWSLVPLRWNHAFFSGDAEVAAIALNPLVWIYDTASFDTNWQNVDSLDSHVDTLSNLFEGDFFADSKFGLDRWITPIAPVVSRYDPIPNIVIVFMESLGATHIGAYGNPLDPTPNLDAVIKESRWYPNFNVSSRSTSKSVFTSIVGIPDVSAIKTATRNPYITHQRSVINSFDRYRKYYMMGGSGGWANISALVTNSIDGVELWEEKSWKSDVVDVWGISDLSLFTEASNILADSSQPFLAYIQTAGNHSPFTIPEDNSDFKVQELDDQVLAEGGFISNKQYNAVRLLDRNIGKMSALFKSKGLYDNTIFIYFSDHQGTAKKVDYLPKYIYQFGLEELPVPLIIHSPRFIVPEIDKTYGSLPDLLPTIAGLFPNYYLNTTLGRDLAWAKNKHLPAYSFIQDTRISVATNGKQIASVNHITGEVITADIDEAGFAIESDNANAMVDAAKAYYFSSEYLLRANVKDLSI